jgi:hypothetical protein
MLLFDSVIGLGNTDDNEEKFGQPPGPKDPPAAETQWTWLAEAMENSTAEYLWVGGHYPVWSACSHGPTGGLVNKLKPMLEKYGAHYMCGHDHCMVCRVRHLALICRAHSPSPLSFVSHSWTSTGSRGRGTRTAVHSHRRGHVMLLRYIQREQLSGQLDQVLGGRSSRQWLPAVSATSVWSVWSATILIRFVHPVLRSRMPFPLLSGFTSIKITDTEMTVDFHAQ